MDSMEFKLNEFSRKDLEGIIHLLHGFFSQFVSENKEFQGYLHCNFIEILEAMSLAESLFFDEYGELCMDEISWKRVKDNPRLPQVLPQLSSASTGKLT
jgi:hypothetical protein